MKIPLSITPIEGKLIIHRNGTTDVVDTPFAPFILGQADKFPDYAGSIIELTKVPENEIRQYKKIEFSSIRELTEFKIKESSKSAYVLANSVAEQLYVSFEDFLLNYPHTNDLKIMFFDIEVATKGDGLFPKALTNEILCIGYSIWRYTTDGKKVKDKIDIIHSFDRETMSDKQILIDFMNIIQAEDPDIIAGYNSTPFDFPYILERAEINNLNTSKIGRTNVQPKLIEDGIMIPGRIHFDIYNSNAGVAKDQTLFGIKDRTLKELGRFYNAVNDNNELIEDVEIPEHIENLLKLYDNDKDLLFAYLMDDIFRTECVGDVYIRNCIMLAERMKVPLQSIIMMYSSFIPKVIVSRWFEKEKLINTETNFNKYNFQNGSIAQVGVKYEGALVGLYKDGLVENTYKIDFASMYPSCVSKDTEILTDKGWINVSNINTDSSIITVSDDQNYTLLQKPKVYNKTLYTGKMYEIENNDISQCITPNHRVPYFTKRGHFHVDECSNVNWDKVHIPISAINNGRLPTKDEYKLLEIIIQMIIEKKVKTIPEFIFELDISYRKFFILELMKGDGHKIANSYVFTQKRLDIMNSLQMLCCLSGFKATLTKEYTDKRNNRKWYYLRICEKSTSTYSKTETNTFNIIDYNDYVYCPTFENYDSFFIRRNGKVSITKNSIQTFNLGPDTTSLVRAIRGPDKNFAGEEGWTGKFAYKQDSKFNWYRIPTGFDKKARQFDLIIKVRNDKEGFLKKEISGLRNERVKIKAELSESKKAKDNNAISALNSQQNAIKVILNCFHPDTEILTETGIKFLKDVTVGEKVWSINPETGRSELKEVEKTYEYDIVDQDFYYTTHQRFSQGVTEGHKMLGVEKNKIFFEEAKDFVKRNRVEIPKGNGDLVKHNDFVYLLDYINNPNDYELIIKHTEDLRIIKSKFKNVSFKKCPTLKIGSVIASNWGTEIKNICENGYTILARNKRSGLCSAVPIMVNTNNLSKLIGYYLSEGNLYINKEKIYELTKRGISKKINIAQYDCNKEIKENIKICLKSILKSSIKCNIYEDKKGFSFSSDLYADFIETNLGTYFNKFISKNIFDTLNLEIIQDSMYQGDGTKAQRKYTISCKNKSLFNSYLELLIRCGKTFSYYIDSDCYRIVDKNSNITLKKSNTIKTKYTGKVYSLTVKDNHTVYAGLNGRMGWIGQSVYGFLGLKSSKYGEMISAAMVTGMCRWTTGKVIRRFKNELIELDSVTGDTPIYVYNLESNMLEIIPIEDLHNSEDKQLSYNGKYLIYTRNGWSKILYTKKHKVNKNIHRVKISDGYVDCTEDHSLFDINKKEISPKNITAKLSKIETIPNMIIEDLGESDESEEDFCWLIGFLIAEGSVYEGLTKNGKEKRQVSFNGNDKNLMLKVEKLANKYFDKKIFANSKFKLHNTIKSSAAYKVQGGYNKTICNWLKEKCYTGNRKDKKVPDFILNGSKEMKLSFLEGINANRKIEYLDSKFKSLAAGIRLLWNSLDYETICCVRKDKLNITTYRKRVPYKNGTIRNIDKNIVLQNNIISNEEWVYDVSTNDGTFVTALGNIVLHNTDGLILDIKPDEEEVNKWLSDIIYERFGIKDNYMQMEVEEFGRSFFYAMKNYVVQEGNKILIHGSSLKASRFSNVEDRARDLAIEHVLNNKPKEEVIREAYDFSNCTISDFTQRIRLKKPCNEYDDPLCRQVFLAKQVEMKTNQILTFGETMSYVVTKSRLPYKEFRQYYKDGHNYTYVGFVNNVNEIDFSYYIQLIDKKLAMFNISSVEQLDLFNETKHYAKKLDVVPEGDI